MREIIINNKYVSDDKSTYTYRFPLGSQPTFTKGDKIALDSLSIYYSWPSITSSNANNQFSYTWPTSSGTTTVDITIPDGFYTIDDLNSYLQYKMIANKHYLVDSSGDYVYYIQLSTNSTLYAVQLDVSPLPTSLGTYTYPSGASWTLPAASTYPQFVVPATTTNSISSIIGFAAGSYPSSTSGTSTYSYTSDSTPQVTPVSSVVVTCSLLNNSFSIPNNLLYSFSPNVTYGSQINIVPPSKTFIDMAGGKVSEFSITFLDQNFNKLNIKDTNVVIMLTIASEDNVLQDPMIR